MTFKRALTIIIALTSTANAESSVKIEKPCSNCTIVVRAALTRNGSGWGASD